MLPIFNSALLLLLFSPLATALVIPQDGTYSNVLAHLRNGSIATIHNITSFSQASTTIHAAPLSIESPEISTSYAETAGSTSVPISSNNLSTSALTVDAVMLERYLFEYGTSFATLGIHTAMSIYNSTAWCYFSDASWCPQLIDHTTVMLVRNVVANSKARNSSLFHNNCDTACIDIARQLVASRTAAVALAWSIKSVNGSSTNVTARNKVASLIWSLENGDGIVHNRMQQWLQKLSTSAMLLNGSSAGLTPRSLRILPDVDVPVIPFWSLSVLKRGNQQTNETDTENDIAAAFEALGRMSVPAVIGLYSHGKLSALRFPDAIQDVGLGDSDLDALLLKDGHRGLGDYFDPEYSTDFEDRLTAWSWEQIYIDMGRTTAADGFDPTVPSLQESLDPFDSSSTIQLVRPVKEVNIPQHLAEEGYMAFESTTARGSKQISHHIPEELRQVGASWANTIGPSNRVAKQLQSLKLDGVSDLQLNTRLRDSSMPLVNSAGDPVITATNSDGQLIAVDASPLSVVADPKVAAIAGRVSSQSFGTVGNLDCALADVIKSSDDSVQLVHGTSFKASQESRFLIFDNSGRPAMSPDSSIAVLRRVMDAGKPKYEVSSMTQIMHHQELAISAITNEHSSSKGKDGENGVPDWRLSIDGANGVPGFRLSVDGANGVPEWRTSVDGHNGVPDWPYEMYAYKGKYKHKHHHKGSLDEHSKQAITHSVLHILTMILMRLLAAL